MRVHGHIVDRIAEAWMQIFAPAAEARNDDKVIKAEMKRHRQWGARDRRFFAENVYEGVRWWRKLWWLLDEEEQLDQHSLKRLWCVLQMQMQRELPENWDLLSISEMEMIDARLHSKKNNANLAVLESIPDWMNQWGQKEHGDHWSAILAALNQAAPVDLRVNTLRAQPEQVIESLKKDGISARALNLSPEKHPGALPTMLTLTERKNVFSSEAFKKGWFEVQDRSSQQIAPLLRVEPGHRVIDACAGAGGKSLHLAALMKNKGKILSLDIHEWKLKELKERARRDGVDVIETRVIDSNKVIKRLEKSADRLLLDVPCSGMGVLRRNPDSKWKLTREEVDRLLQLQAEILSSYSSMLKSGGLMVYATCSIMKSENQAQVERFLQEHKDFDLLQTLTITPDFPNSGDGFFAAVLKRN